MEVSKDCRNPVQADMDNFGGRGESLLQNIVILKSMDSSVYGEVHVLSSAHPWNVSTHQPETHQFILEESITSNV